ncbi:O-antigen ligase family protein [Vibrio ulleungensis]|uniref:O-antigen ligase family protein n=1 Tax=Vibrio ulleungensis TaxID=2807619 RepID=A0ABS2HM74_9VIBR|nr:O-antigen ligase family protein [Vibrio ulleungensis]MBM7037672.1 O-antigen ligase family protein [Vibrio ulleungensis]
MNNKNRLLSVFSYLPLIWIVTGMFWYSRGDKFLVGIMAISFLVITVINGPKSIINKIKSSSWLKLILLYLAFAVVSGEIHGFNSRETRALIISALFLMSVNLSTLNFKYIALLMLVASINGLIYVTNFQIIDPVPRNLWPVNPLPFAASIAVLASISLSLLIVNKKPRTRIFFGINLLILTITLLATDIRSAIIAFVVFVGLTVLWLVVKSKNRGKVMAIGMVILSLSAVLSYPITKNRIIVTIGEVQAISAGNLDTSIGQRLQVYNVALGMIPEAPIFGHGNKLAPRWDAMLESGEITPLVHQVVSWDFHNDYFEKWVKYGLVGLIFMLILLLYPVYRAIKSRHDDSLIIVGPPVVFAVAAMAYTPFSDARSLTVYIIATSLCMAYSQKEQSRRKIRS